MWAKKAYDQDKSQGEAAYLIGLCEFRQHQIDASKDWFNIAVQSEHDEVRGKAAAMLGIIASNKGDFVTATLSFEQAAEDLDGQDKTQAETRATASARGTSYSIVNSGGGFTLQFGAYQSLENARDAASKIGDTLRLAGLGNPSIVKDTSKVGRTLFIVQAGSFDSRSEASRYRTRNSLPQCIVTALQ